MLDEPIRKNLQAVEITRKGPQKSWVPREVSDSVVARVREHQQPIGRVARATGISTNDAVEILLDRWEREKEAAQRQGYAEARWPRCFRSGLLAHSGRQRESLLRSCITTQHEVDWIGRGVVPAPSFSRGPI